MNAMTCTECGLLTDDTVVAGRVHAATGPGHTLYICRQCLPHTPPYPDDDLTTLARFQSWRENQ
ncbi:hypothetical protein JJV70_02485 [Streptomyces sp. JJ66]|uniref:hypothetical protein n=1 Tax=Streptomyces sp. JJ66 TaxID=2803843 RepID=UPI001C570BAB|nr:hypothetical protein [Streptomyces sp. JJ66]MBW1600989.1 hypothetical protein [Streptomyces sp. JJ66]